MGSDISIEDLVLKYFLPKLPFDYRLSYRQVCRKWKDALDPTLNFGLMITDDTVKSLNNLDVSTLSPIFYKNIAIYNLHTSIKSPAAAAIKFKDLINVYIGMTREMINAPPFVKEKLKSEENAIRSEIISGIIPGSSSKENVLKILEIVQTAAEHICIGLLAPTRNIELGRDFFNGLHYPHLKSLECHVYESELKAIHHGLFKFKFPCLTMLHLHYYVKPLFTALDDCYQLYTFILRHEGKIDKIILNDPPVPHHRKNPQGDPEHKTLNMGEAKVRHFEVSISYREQYNHRTLDLQFLTSQRNLEFVKLTGVSLPEVYAVIRNNGSTLREFHTRDFPGHRTLQKSKLFDCGNLEAAVDLAVCCFHDYRICNFERMPRKIVHCTAVNFFDDKTTFLSNSANFKPIECNVVSNVTRTLTLMPDSTTIVILECCNGLNKLYTNQGEQPIPDRTAIPVQIQVPTLPGPININTEVNQIGLPAVTMTIKTAYAFLTHETLQEELKQIKQSLELARIRRLGEASTSSFRDLSLQLQGRIFEYLDLEDRKNCRLVNKEWQVRAQEFMQFGFWLNDSTLEWVQNSNLKLAWLAISDLKTPLSPAKLSFISNVGDLVIEVHADTFSRGTDADCNANPDLVYIPNNGPSILEANLIKVLKNASNAFSLCLHRWALSCLKSFDKLEKFMADVKLANLSELTVLITGNSELRALTPLLKKIFPRLREVNFKFFQLQRTSNMVHYDDIFEFLSSNKRTIKRLQLINPPHHPPTPIHKNKIEKPLRLFNDVCSIRVKELTIKMLEYPLDPNTWALTQTLLEKSSALVKLHCEGIPSSWIERAINASAGTLTTLAVHGQNTKGNFNINLEKCSNLKTLQVKEYKTISQVQKLPKSIVSLELDCEAGISSAGVNHISTFPNLEHVMISNQDYLERSTYKAFLENPYITFLALSKHEKKTFKPLKRSESSSWEFQLTQNPIELMTISEEENDKNRQNESNQVSHKETEQTNELRPEEITLISS